MKSKKQRTIEEIVLEGFATSPSRCLPCEAMTPKKEVPFRRKENLKHIEYIVKQIKQLIADEVIEENETPIIQTEYPELGKLKIDTTEFNQAITRNSLRKKQRKKLERL